MIALRQRIRELGSYILHQHTAPYRIALAVLIGCLVGCTPFLGLHLAICIGLAWLLRLNQVVVYGAANISLPPFIPFLGFVSVQLGERLRSGHWLRLTIRDFSRAHAAALAKQFFVDWLLGGLVLGSVIGIVAASIVYWVLARRQRAARLADPIEAILTQAAARYLQAPSRFKWYARMKYRLDPCYRAIAPLIPPGSYTVDLGTGLGMLPVVIGLLAGGRRALGVEWDEGKLRAGAVAVEPFSDVKLMNGDVRTFVLPPCDVITIVDLLHYYDAATQRELLQRCHAALAANGKLLIREGDRSRVGGARLTRLFERIVTRLGWNRGESVQFRPIEELKRDLEKIGFHVRIDEVAGQLHPGNVLLIADR